MKKAILFFLIVISNILYSAQLITDGQIAFYYDEKNQEIKNIKGNLLNDVDITKLDIGIIEDKKYYKLEEFYTAREYDLENLEIKFKGVFKESEFTLKIKISEEFSNELDIIFTTTYKKPLKIIYGINFLSENGIIQLNKDSEYSFEDRIYFSDKYKKGTFVLSEEDETLEDVYKFLKVKNREKIEGKNSYYILDLTNGESFFRMKFGNFKNEKSKRVVKDGIFGDEDRVQQIKQLEQLSILLSRGVIIDRITENMPKISDIDEIDIKIMGYKKGIIDLAELVTKTEYSKSEELYYQYSIYKLISEDDFLLKYKEIIEKKVVNFIDKNYQEIHKAGEIKDIYYLIKTMDLLEKSQIKKYVENKKSLINFVNRELFVNKGLKNNRYSKIENRANMKYMDILYPENLNAAIEHEYTRNYDKIYGLLMKKNDKGLIDIGYNLDFIRLLKFSRDDKRAYIIMGKIEELIKKNNYYIPLYYDNSGYNNKEIYGELIIKYLKFYLE